MKKILTVGYYADFSRFFKEISDELLKLSSDYEFLHVNLHLSGYLYSLVHRQKSIYLPFAATQKQTRKITTSDISYDSFIKYHLVLNSGIDAEKLLTQAHKYYDYFSSLLTEYRPDLVIVSGDSRMPVEILQYITKKNSIKTYHFEQAPFGRTILDPNGVNANCTCRNVDLSEIEGIDQDEDIIICRSEKWRGYRKYRAIDLAIEKLLPSLQPIEHLRPQRKVVNENLYEQVKFSTFKGKEGFSGKVFLLVLQVPDDVNMIYHSPYFSNHFDIVKAVHRALPDGAALIVREHPLYKRLYEPELYSYILANDNAYFDDSPQLVSAMNAADVIIVNNSTVGLEAIEIGKPVVALGNSYYDKFPLCYKYDGNNLKQILLSATSQLEPFALSMRKKYLNFLFNRYFIAGHFRDVKGPAPFNIAKWINDNVY